MTWAPLRGWLREQAAAWVDQLIQTERDPRSRASLAFHRDRLVDQLTDKAMVATIEGFLVQRERAEPHVPSPPPRVNGHAKVH